MRGTRMRRIGAEAARNGTGLMEMLDEVAEVVAFYRKHKGLPRRPDDDTSYLADAAIEAYEEVLAARE